MVGSTLLRSRRAIGWMALLLLFLVPSARASVEREEGQGQRLLREVHSGRLDCGSVAPSEFELIGEYAMGRALGSSSTHEAMNERMVRMMGPTGEERMHEAMGRRASGCDPRALPLGFGRMMTAVGIMGGGLGAGSMMGGYGWGHHSGGGHAVAWLLAIALVLLAATVTVLLLTRTKARRSENDRP